MRNLREVLRLRFELKLGYQQIGRSCSIGVSTVHKYLKRAEAAGSLAHELIEIRSTPTTIEILRKGARVASHLRSRGRGQTVSHETCRVGATRLPSGRI